MDLIIPENLRARHWEGYDRVMVQGEPSRYGRREMLKVPALRKDARASPSSSPCSPSNTPNTV